MSEMLGMAVSLRGHDKDGLFFVLEHDDKSVLLADGKNRKLDKPKRKNRRHVRFLTDDASRAACHNVEKHITDAAMRREIAAYRNAREKGGS